ncbi:hypothetical protein DPMN_187108 [Dreissena polymorpha]|uniref:Uncharacterized protein n=1 Tax=Dreissena polymorpha TaxID=45954 RepID=A0A9D4DPX1_DREPO|nr:hypothetical protein DPMN_187108 [Dreissena polymorpha]
MTLCEQDFANISVQDQDLRDLVFAKSVQVYTTEKFRHHFASGSNETTRIIMLRDIKYDIEHTNKFALVDVDNFLEADVNEFLKDAAIGLAGLVLVDDILHFPELFKIRLLVPKFLNYPSCIKTQPNEIMKNADYLMEMCALSLLKSIRLSVHQYEGNRSGSGE